jgi:outer membrane protein OmpA-like peptidoglycan-associated protein
MNFRSKSILFSIILFFWCIGSCNWYTCRIKGYCINDFFGIFGQPTIELPAKPVTPLIYFKFNDSNVYSENIDSFKKLVCDSFSKDSFVLIEGFYYQNELDSDSNANLLGLARANQLKEMLKICIDSNKIQTISSLFNGKSDTFLIAYQIQAKKLVDYSQIKETSLVSNGDILEIRFPSGNSQVNEKADLSILNTIIEKVALSKTSKILVEGHTDNSGDENKNNALSTSRCIAIKKILIQKGIQEQQIEIKSYGSKKPKVSNDSEINKAINRRVELKVIQ